MTFSKNRLLATACAFVFALSYSTTEAKGKKNLKLEGNADKEERKEKLKTLNKSRFKNVSTGKASEEVKKRDQEIGLSLSNAIHENPDKVFTYKGISIKRILSPSENKLGADIISFGTELEFHHVNSLVRVVASYIDNNFDYNESDSELIGLYVVYYNLKHRKNHDYFTKHFTKQVAVSLKPQKVGVPDEIKTLPGESQLVIPIEGNILKGKGIDIATFELEDQVNPDIDSREGGSDSKKKFSDFQNKKLDQERTEINPKIEAANKKIKSLEDRKKAIEDRLKELYKDPVKNKAEIEKLEAQKKKIEDQLTTLVAERQKMIDKEKQVSRREDMRKKGITSERDYIEQFEKNKKETTKKPEAGKEVVENKKETKKEVVKKEEPPVVEKREINTDRFFTSFKGSDSVVLGKEFIVVSPSENYILGYEQGKDELKLLLLDNHYKKVKETGSSISKKSPLVYGDGKFFIMEEENGSTYLSSYDKGLNKLLKGPAVNPESSCKVVDDKIIVTEPGDSKSKAYKTSDFSPVTE